MPHEYSFASKLAFSRASRGRTDEETIRTMMGDDASLIDSTVGNKGLDKQGVDYIVSLAGGGSVYIDAKAREKGCSRWWKPLPGSRVAEPELALEIWSVLPNGLTPGKPGWTLDESKLTDYTLHTFDQADTSESFLLPFQLLRVAFRKRLAKWIEVFRVSTQSSGTWKSQCVFVPAKHVMDAICEEIRPSLRTTSARG